MAEAFQNICIGICECVDQALRWFSPFLRNKVVPYQEGCLSMILTDMASGAVALALFVIQNHYQCPCADMRDVHFILGRRRHGGSPLPTLLRCCKSIRGILRFYMGWGMLVWFQPT